MNDSLRIGLLQYDIIWECPQDNMAKIEDYLSRAEDLDLLLLPEMFNTGFSMDTASNAETMEGNTMIWLKSLSFKNDMIIIGSIMISEFNNHYNRALIVYPNGDTLFYDKRHLFSYGKENLTFTAGSTKEIVEVKGWRICPLICYDLRFPVWSRNNDDYDLLIYMANWPAVRSLAWNSLLKARAIENQAYVCGVNRVGIDANKLIYQGDTQLIDYEGVVKCQLPDIEMLQVIEIKKLDLLKFRSKYKFLQDRDSINIVE